MTAAAGAAAAGPDAATSPHKQPLDDVMLAMDVVDTLRRRERLVTKELSEDGREEDLKERLRKIYAAQGIEVPDRILEEGVRGLREDRFVYSPPGPGIGRSLANLYVSRKRWLPWVAGSFAVVIAVIILNYMVLVAPKQALPGDLAAAHQAVVSIASGNEAKAAADRLLAAGQDAANKGNTDSAKLALVSLRNLRALLEQEFTLRIVNRPDTPTGVWRVPDVNSNARNYYIIVEAIGPSGQVLSVPVKDEETGETKSVKAWGLRVDQSVFNSIGRDKQDNGIIEKSQFGYKKRGDFAPVYDFGTTGAAITRW